MKEKGLTERQRRAVELLFECKESEVAKRVRISRMTLERWLDEDAFRQAVKTELGSYRRTSVRLLARLYLDATMQLNELIHDKEIGNRHKVIVDVLKASGLLRSGMTEEASDPDYVSRLIKRLQNEEDEEDDEGDGDEDQVPVNMGLGISRGRPNVNGRETGEWEQASEQDGRDA